MPMHPAVESFALYPVLDVLLGEGDQPLAALQALTQAGLLDPQARLRWEAELAHPRWQRQRHDLHARAKLLADARAAHAGKLSVSEPLAVLAQLAPLVQLAVRLGFDADLARLQQRTVMDLGSGLYYPLSSSVLLHLNGFGRAVAFEPFPVKPDYAAASLMALVRAVFETPGRFCLFGQSPQGLKRRLAELDLEDLPGRFEQLNRGEVDRVDLGAVQLFQREAALPEDSVDLLFSNSVLEHIPDLTQALQWHRRLLKPSGWCCHTVDFADHRYYFDPALNVMQMYYDGVLDEINGLRPHQMEAAFAAAGFACWKVPKLHLPEQAIDRDRPRQGLYAELPPADLFEWVNGYVLRPSP